MTPLLTVSDGEIYTLWWISIAVLFVVCIVASGLLQNILVIGRNIGANVHEIWTVGKRIANHTVQLWLLGLVNGLVGQIHTTAGHINETAASIANHARTCQHCPACVSPLAGGMIGGTGDEPATAGRT